MCATPTVCVGKESLSVGKWEEIVHEVHFACFDEPEIQKQPYRQDANSVFASVFVTDELVVILLLRITKPYRDNSPQVRVLVEYSAG